MNPALSIQLLNFAAKDPGLGGWQPLLDQARAADEAGVDRLVVSDHVIFGENLAAYGDPRLGGVEGGRQPTGPEGQWLDPLVLLSAWATLTQRTRLMTGILIAGLRRPANLAKATATLDVLSQGRLDLGVGVGWQREEYEANGIAFEHRGARLNQTLEICQQLWRAGSAAYEIDGIQNERVHCNPKPVQPGGIPLWISGTLNPNVLRRITRFGAGWIPWGPDAMNPVKGLEQVRAALEAEGRDPSGFQVTGYLPVAKASGGGIEIEQTVASAPAMVEGGITDLRLTVQVPTGFAAARDFLAPIVEAFRGAVGRS